MSPIVAPPGATEFQPIIPSNLLHGVDLMHHGAGLLETWGNLAYEKPPDDPLGQLFWFFGTLGQIALGIIFFPATLSQFLMEEAMQASGMGAYILFTSKQWQILDDYLPRYKTMIDSGYLAAKDLSIFSPITGGAVVIYSEAARMSYQAMKDTTEIKLVEELAREENRQKLADEALLYGTLSIRSDPSSAEILIDGVHTELLTPETFKRLDIGIHVITLSKYSKQREVLDSYTFEIEIVAGRKKEIFIHIPEDVTSEEEAEEEAETGDLLIRSTPSSAEIYFDGGDTKLLTPESFKGLHPETITIKLRAFSRTLAVWDEYEFDVEIERFRKIELKVNIPGKAFDLIKERLDREETDEPKLDDFVKAQVTGDYALDGDTFQTTAGERIRILGIDTPELGRPWADMAKENLAMLIEDKKITLRIQSHLPIDTYGRTLAICSSYKGNIAILQLSAGLARAFIADDARYDPARYLEAERIAKERRIGIWEELP